MVGAVIAGFVVLGGAIVGIGTIVKKIIPDKCPDTECQKMLHKTHAQTIQLKEGQNFVRDTLEVKRKKIEALQQDVAEIKTDTKWIVSELKRQNHRK
jgi:hypothetical protein